jgi:hypothetical protein
MISDGGVILEEAALRPRLRFRIEDSCICESADIGNNSSSLPSLLRRRVSAVGQLAFRAAWALRPDAATRFIFCSRHGEFDRTLRLLDGVTTGEPLSPADFNLSVGNALAGLLAMATENCAGHTAIAAGEDSFATGLLEAVTCIAAGDDERILLVYFDDVLAGEYSELHTPESAEPMAIALILGVAHGDNGDIVATLLPASACANYPPSASMAADFLRFLQERTETTSVGRQIGWRYRYVAAED